MVSAKVIMVSVLLSSGFTTETTFSDIYTDDKPKTEMDYLTERLGRKLLILFDAKITQIMNEQMKE